MKPSAEAKDALNEVLTAAYSGTLFRDNYGWSAFGLVLVAGAMVRGRGRDRCPLNRQ